MVSDTLLYRIQRRIRSPPSISGIDPSGASGDRESGVSSFLYSVGRRAFAARKTVLLIWLLVLAIAGGGAGLMNQGLDNNVSIPGTEAQNALERLSVTFPQTSGASAQVLTVAPQGVRDPAVRAEIDKTVRELEKDRKSVV